MSRSDFPDMKARVELRCARPKDADLLLDGEVVGRIDNNGVMQVGFDSVALKDVGALLWYLVTNYDELKIGIKDDVRPKDADEEV